MRLELVCKSLGLKNRILRGLLDHWGLLVVEVCENCCTWDVVNLCWLMGWSPKALGLLMNVQNLWLSFSVFLLLRDENILSLRKRLDRLLSKCRGWLRCHLGVVSYVFCVRETWLSWLFVWNWLTIILFLLFFFLVVDDQNSRLHDIYRRRNISFHKENAPVLPKSLKCSFNFLVVYWLHLYFVFSLYSSFLNIFFKLSFFE